MSASLQQPWTSRGLSNGLTYKGSLAAAEEPTHGLQDKTVSHQGYCRWMTDLPATETKVMAHPPLLSLIPPVYEPVIGWHLGKRVDCLIFRTCICIFFFFFGLLWLRLHYCSESHRVSGLPARESHITSPLTKGKLNRK